MKALIVDDDVDIHELLAEVLFSNNFDSECMESPVEALACLKQRSSEFQLIVTDISMPEMDGYQFIHGVRQLGIKTPIIAVTGISLAALKLPVEEESGRKSPDICLSKPFSYEDFYNAIGEISHLIEYKVS